MIHIFGVQLVFFVFRFINLGMLICLFIYLFKKYVQPELHKEAEEKRLHDESLIKQRDYKLKSDREMDLVLMSNEHQCQKLINSIDQWNTAIKKDFVHFNQEMERIKKQLVVKYAQQAQLLERELIAQKIAPQVIATVHNHYKNTYSSEQEQRKFFDDLLSYIDTPN